LAWENFGAGEEQRACAETRFARTHRRPDHDRP
jgi:hypothetical protein